MDEPLKIGGHYSTTYGTLWKDGTYFPRGTEVSVVGLHLDQGFCVRFPAVLDGEPLETWEDWSEVEFLADEGTDRAAESPAIDGSARRGARRAVRRGRRLSPSPARRRRVTETLDALSALLRAERNRSLPDFPARAFRKLERWIGSRPSNRFFPALGF